MALSWKGIRSEKEALKLHLFLNMMKEYIVFVLNALITMHVLNYYIPRRALRGNMFVSFQVKLIKYLHFLGKHPILFFPPALPCSYYKLVIYFIFPLCSLKITSLAFKRRRLEKHHLCLFPSSLTGTVEMILLLTTDLFQNIRKFK